MHLQTENLDDYLSCDSVVDWKTVEIQEKALELTGPFSSEIAKARCLYEWVRDEISHSNDAGIDMVTCTASDVLRQGTGICFAKSHLLAALLRAVAIPAGFCYQALRLAPPENNELVLHGLNGVYLASLGRWIIVDARGNKNGCNAQFNVEREQLAFAMDPSAGEFIYSTIFSAPIDAVVERLQKYDSRQKLWLDLPKPLHFG